MNATNTTTRSTSPEGSPTVTTQTTAETTEAPAVPATFLAPPAGEACEQHPWCVETGPHADHSGRDVYLPTADGLPILQAHLYTAHADGVPELDYNRGCDDWREYRSGDELRAEVARVRAHLVRLEALADEYDAITEATETPNPSGRMWTITTTNGITATGYLPAWAKNDPSESGLDPKLFVGHVDDVKHVRWYPGQVVDANLCNRWGRTSGETAILCPQMECDPFDEDPAKHVPTVAIELTEGSDDWIQGMDPAGVADLAAKLRAQADVLDQVATDLAEARADWTANGGAQR